MTKERLLRVIWRMEEMTPFIAPDIYSNHQLDVAIMEECGSSDRTLRDIKKQLRKIGAIASNGLGTWKINKPKSRNVREELDLPPIQTNLECGTIDTPPLSQIPPNHQTTKRLGKIWIY